MVKRGQNSLLIGDTIIYVPSGGRHRSWWTIIGVNPSNLSNRVGIKLTCAFFKQSSQYNQTKLLKYSVRLTAKVNLDGATDNWKREWQSKKIWSWVTWWAVSWRWWCMMSWGTDGEQFSHLSVQFHFRCDNINPDIWCLILLNTGIYYPCPLIVL